MKNLFIFACLMLSVITINTQVKCMYANIKDGQTYSEAIYVSNCSQCPKLSDYAYFKCINPLN